MLVVTNDFPPRRGGIESFVAGLCSGLPTEQVVVYTAAMPGSAAFDETLGHPVIRDRSPRLLPTPRVARAVQEVAGRYGCDRALFGAAAPLGLLAPALRKSGVTRVVGLTHGHEVWWAKVPGAQQLLHRIGDDVDVLTYVSEYCRREIARGLSGAAVRRMVRLSPGVDIDRFHPGADGALTRESLGIDADRPVVLAAARLVRRKGHDMLIRAWPRILRHAPGSLLLIAGDGPSERRLRGLAAQVGVSESVRHLTGMTWERMPQVYAAADVFALPCRTRLGGLEPEAFGIVFLEAAAAGLPVVVGASGGAPETVAEAETGYVVDPKDVGQIAERVASLLTSPVVAAQMGSAGRARVVEEWQDSRPVQILQQLLA